jgi:hypothetical protein
MKKTASACRGPPRAFLPPHYWRPGLQRVVETMVMEGALLTAIIRPGSR